MAKLVSMQLRVGNNAFPFFSNILIKIIVGLFCLVCLGFFFTNRFFHNIFLSTFIVISDEGLWEALLRRDLSTKNPTTFNHNLYFWSTLLLFVFYREI